MALLSVRDLSVTFHTPGGVVEAVRGISFDLDKGETLLDMKGSGNLAVVVLWGNVPKTGATMLGEVWYSEADRPEGPWVNARKIITHANKPGDAHDFYNPTQHPFFDQEGGRVVYLEGSYVNTFSGNPHPTPYYEYNQIMYRLDLSDPRLKLPEGPAAT